MARDESNVVSMARVRGTVDDTGQRVTMDLPRRRKRKKGWRDSVSLVDVGILTRLELSGLESRVLWMIARHIPEKGGNEARVALAEVADKTGIHPSDVSKIVRTLRARHLLRTVRRGVHEVSPWLLWSGDFDSWNAEADKWPEPTWVRGADPDTGEVR